MDKIENIYKLAEPIYVTRPRMPELAEYNEYLEQIWASRWLTNNGQFHIEFEKQLKDYFGLEHVNLFVNATIGLLVALQSLDIDSGEVITTPFTFAATTHVIHWNRVTPVFCDIDEKTFNIDPNEIEKLITPDTKAILAVHVYGTPCDIDAIQSIADKHGLYVIYDAAHAFGVKIDGRSILDYGDLSVLSFHATKLFNSIEGGATFCHTQKICDRIQSLKNFGIIDEETVISPGINGKMNEFQAAFGLLGLKQVDQEISDRKKLTEIYRLALKDVPGISMQQDIDGVTHNYSYFPILVESDSYGCTRDELYTAFRECNVYTRKYFYPLCSDFKCYSALPSAKPENLPVAQRVSKQVLCLPLYGDLEEEIVLNICSIVQQIHLLCKQG